MSKFRQVIPWLWGLILATQLFIGFHVAQTSQSTPSSLSTMSGKELSDKADQDYLAGRYEDAREAIILALEKKKNKPNKDYLALLDKINMKLANQEALKGEEACKNEDLALCEKQIPVAKKFATTERVQQLEATFNRSLNEIRQRRDAAVKLAETGKPDKALPDLKSLGRFRAYLPKLDSDIEHVTQLLVQMLLEEGKKMTEIRRWEEASQRYQRVLELAKDNETARSGLKDVDRGRKADTLYNDAMAQLSVNNYGRALNQVNSAIALDPEAGNFRQGFFKF